MSDTQWTDIVGYPREDIETAITSAAREASEILHYFYINPDFIITKDKIETEHVSPVTFLDPLIESLIQQRLEAAFPHIGFMGEETGVTEKDSPLRWSVDPIDGTRAFSNGNPLFAVSIGLENTETGEHLASVIALPALQTMVFATKGGGARQIDMAILHNETELTDSIAAIPSAASSPRARSTPLTIASQSEQDSTMLTVDIPAMDFIASSLRPARVSSKGIGEGFISLGGASLRSDPSLPEKLRTIFHAEDRSPRFQWDGSTAIGLALVAMGRNIAFAQDDLHRHDCVAGTLIVEEAGGHAAILNKEAPGKCACAAAATSELLELVSSHIISAQEKEGPHDLSAIAKAQILEFPTSKDGREGNTL